MWLRNFCVLALIAIVVTIGKDCDGLDCKHCLQQSEESQNITCVWNKGQIDCCVLNKCEHNDRSQLVFDEQECPMILFMGLWEFAAFCAFVVSVIGLCICICWKRRQKRLKKKEKKHKLINYSYNDELLSSTTNLSRSDVA